MKPRKRSVTINGHRTSISLEPAFWDALAEVAHMRALSLAALISEIDRARISGAGMGCEAGPHSGPQPGLSGAIRVYLLNHYRSRQKMSAR